MISIKKALEIPLHHSSSSAIQLARYTAMRCTVASAGENFSPPRYSTINCKWCYNKAEVFRNPKQHSHKMSDRVQLQSGFHRALRHTVLDKSLQRSADSITAEFQTSSGINITTKLCARSFMAAAVGLTMSNILCMPKDV